MILDDTHGTVAVLQRLLPGVTVAGGSFVGSLPPPATMMPDQRRVAFEATRELAARHCLGNLLERVGLRSDLEIPVGEGGDRRWPVGFVGSLTHKGTVVLGAIASSSVLRAVGIDLERLSGPSLRPIAHILGEMEPSTGDEEAKALETFAAKEAVFKAQYPMTRRKLGFLDVRLEWELETDDDLRAVAVCPHGGSFQVRSSWVENWLVAAAYLKV
jgi:4'-phosphopantetheinyl transferase EntD